MCFLKVGSGSAGSGNPCKALEIFTVDLILQPLEGALQSPQSCLSQAALGRAAPAFSRHLRGRGSQSSDHLHGPPLEFLQLIHVLVLGTPELDVCKLYSRVLLLFLAFFSVCMKTVGCFQVKYIMRMHSLPLLIGARVLLG